MIRHAQVTHTSKFLSRLRFSPNCAALDGASVVPGDAIVSVCRSVAAENQTTDSGKEEKLKKNERPPTPRRDEKKQLLLISRRRVGEVLDE